MVLEVKQQASVWLLPWPSMMTTCVARGAGAARPPPPGAAELGREEAEEGMAVALRALEPVECAGAGHVPYGMVKNECAESTCMMLWAGRPCG